MEIIGIIPARYASTRFPGKPLANIRGKSMIQRVFEQACKAQLLQSVYIATDHELIAEHASSFTKNIIITADTHQTGTERCAEAIMIIDTKANAVINIQGDEPYIFPQQIDTVAAMLKENNDAIVTLKKRISSNSPLIDNPNTVKVTTTLNDDALYFSRSPIPYNRSGNTIDYFKHIGIYGFPIDILNQIVKLPPSPLEQSELLEQLRWLENGYRIKVGITEYESQAVDTPEDIDLLPNN
ncbi:MAG: 3-deoxy-manno-octulosonate cytidylyltransferase [Chitinophagales bacterium]|nr:3-deoxy-manno-octulosonate cytidylyltransferase [Chitinophagales bacterium]